MWLCWAKLLAMSSYWPFHYASSFRWCVTIAIFTDDVYSLPRAIGTKTTDCSMWNGRQRFTAISPQSPDSFYSSFRASKSTGKISAKCATHNVVIDVSLPFAFYCRISRLTLKQLEASFLGLFLDVLFGITSSLMTFAAAIMITLGFISWCNDMTQRFPS